jgi:hypothetical protein
MRVRELNRVDPLTSPLLDDPTLQQSSRSPSPFPFEDFAVPFLSHETSDLGPDDFADSDPFETVTGPALPDDLADQIYDDWRGALAQEMPVDPDRDGEGYILDVLDRLAGGDAVSETVENEGESTASWGMMEDPLKWEELAYERSDSRQGMSMQMSLIWEFWLMVCSRSGTRGSCSFG